MASPETSTRIGDPEFKARQRAMWALGDYHRVATEWLWSLGPRLVAVCGISRGMRVLDVAAGTGNVAIRAAEAGARVIASDLTPEHFAAGRREARARGVELEWVEADAEELPFGDGEFDVVTSSVGAIFAPNQRKVADELLRVCRAGGTIGLIALRPDSRAGELFEMFERYAQRDVGSAPSPLLWGREEHVRALFGNRVESLELRPERFAVSHVEDPLDFREFLKANHPMVISLYRDLAADPARVEALDREFAEVMRAPRDDAELVLILARKRRPPVRRRRR